MSLKPDGGVERGSGWVAPLGPWPLGDRRLTVWYDDLRRVAFTQHEEYVNGHGYNHWSETSIVIDRKGEPAALRTGVMVD